MFSRSLSLEGVGEIFDISEAKYLDNPLVRDLQPNYTASRNGRSDLLLKHVRVTITPW